METASTGIDLPDWELAFRFEGGHLALALTATVGERWRRNFERLISPERLAQWFVEAGLADRPPPVDPSVLAQARQLREAVYGVVCAGAGVPRGSGVALGAAVATLNTWAARPRVIHAVGPGGARVLVPRPDQARRALAEVAVAAVDLATGPELARVRECGSDECALLFLDTSRPGRRRWCADGACGTRARSAAYRSRRHPR